MPLHRFYYEEKLYRKSVFRGMVMPFPAVAFAVCTFAAAFVLMECCRFRGRFRIFSDNQYSAALRGKRHALFTLEEKKACGNIE